MHKLIESNIDVKIQGLGKVEIRLKLAIKCDYLGKQIADLKELVDY